MKNESIFIDLFTFVYIMQSLSILFPIFIIKYNGLSEANNPPESPFLNEERRVIIWVYYASSNLNKAMDIGIFGGSFNPIHIGHLIVAEEVFQQRGLSKVIFMPTEISPHKESSDLIDSFHRYQMVKSAISDNEHFEVSDIEIKRSGKSYTIDTIRILREIYGEEYNLYLIMGTDMINEMSTWKEISILSGMCRFIMVNRSQIPTNGFSKSSFPECGIRGIKVFSDEKIAEIEDLKVTIPPIGISSTEIREKLRNRRSIRYLVPQCVEDYIKTYNLYGRC